MFGKFLQSPAQEEGGKEPGLFFCLLLRLREYRKPRVLTPSLLVWPQKCWSSEESDSYSVAEQDSDDTDFCLEMKHHRTPIQDANNLPFEMHQNNVSLVAF